VIVSARELRTEELRLRYLSLLQRPDVYPTKVNWQYITESGMRGLCSLLYGKYLTALTIGDADRDDLHDVAVEEFPKYLANVEIGEACDAVYGDIDTMPDVSAGLIRDAGLFDAGHLLNILLNGQTEFVFKVIDVYRREYDSAQLVAMKRLADYLGNIPESGHYEQRHGIFGMQTKYICPNGHNNPADTVYCSHCGLDIHGVPKDGYQKIEDFMRRIEALESLLESTTVI